MPLHFVSQITENDRRIQQIKSEIDDLQNRQSNKVYSLLVYCIHLAVRALFGDYNPARQDVLYLVATAL
jgi:hypothetical protein